MSVKDSSVERKNTIQQQLPPWKKTQYNLFNHSDTASVATSCAQFTNFPFERFRFATAVSPQTDQVLLHIVSQVKDVGGNDQILTKMDQQRIRNGYQLIKCMAVEFQLDSHTGILFYDKFTLAQNFGQDFATVAILRKYGTMQTYLFYLRLYGYIKKRKFSLLMKNLIKAVTNSPNVVAKFKKLDHDHPFNSLSQILNIYAGQIKDNILLLKVDAADMTASQVPLYQGKNELNAQELKKKLQSTFDKEFSNMCLLPLQFNTLLRQLQQLSQEELEEYLEEHDIETIFL